MALTKVKLSIFDTTGTPDATTFLRGDGQWALAPAGATGGGTDTVFVENSRVITTSYTFSANKSAFSIGPITQNDGVSVTIPSGERWIIF